MKSHDAHTLLNQTPANSVPPGAGGAPVLLVEDDATLRRYFEVLLRRAGFAVITAADGLEAIKIAFTTPVVAVVTDAVMPRLGGRELCRILRGNERLSRLPIVLLSGIANGDEAPDARAQADVQLIKPVRAAELVECLRRLIQLAA